MKDYPEPSIALIGLGAIGIMYASKLSERYGSSHVYIIADENRIRRYQSEGIYANGRLCEFNYVTPDAVPETDLLIFTVKNYSLPESIQSAAGACGKDTIVLSFLNGVTSEEMIEEQLHPEHLLYSTVQGMDATRTGNHLEYTQLGSITLGEKDNTRTPALEKALSILQEAGFTAIVPDDMIHQMWNKWMLNCGVNQPCAAAGCGYGGVQEGGEVRDMMISAMEEARTAAGLQGIKLTAEDRDRWFQVIASLDPDKEPSMRQDTRAGRLTEVDCFAGLVRSICHRHGIKTPVNDLLYEKLMKMNEAIQQ